MYIPKHFEGSDELSAIEFMQKFSFASVVSVGDGAIEASHMPFIVYKDGNDLVICSHFSKRNDQWKLIQGSENLVIFMEPHAYISPKNYEKIESVPTWNYIAVHAYGFAKLIEDRNQVLSLMKKMITRFEPDYLEQWNQISEEYRQRMLNGIVMFEIKVSRIEFKEKLSQNRSLNERISITENLEYSKNSLAEYMRDKLGDTK